MGLLSDLIRSGKNTDNLPEQLQRLPQQFEAKPPSSNDEMPELAQKIVARVKKRQEEMDKTHCQYRPKWDRLYGLWRNYDDLKSDYSAARQANDTDGARGVLLDGGREWGGLLFIPYAFATVETVVPRVITNPPKWQGRPRKSEAAESAEAVQDLMNQEQQNINYELLLQPTARRGLKFGLGVQFAYWQKKSRKMDRNVPARRGGYQTVEQEVTLREGPMVEDVDIYDFFWDESAKNIETCDDVVRRTWRSNRYVERMIESGQWFKVDMEAVNGMASPSKRDEIWAGRMKAQGLSKMDTREGRLHEVWEYHDCDYVYTVLDGNILVAADRTPFYHRSLPFQVYRPTMVEGEMPGIGEIEPIEDLVAELNTLRSQRRDNATFVLNRAYAYAEGFVNRKNLKIGPGMAIPTQGDPREAIFPLPVEDIPASGYAEENAMKQDIELASGVSEVTAGSQAAGESAGSETATGIQLVQAAANVRIAMKAKMLVLEVGKPTVWQFQDLYAQHTLEPFEMRIDDSDSQEGYRFIEVTPEQLQTDIDWVPEDGSTEPENKPQKLNNALTLFQQLMQSEIADQAEALKYLLKEFGVQNPERFIAEPEAVSPEALGMAMMVTLTQQFGVPEEQAQQMVLEMTQQAQNFEAEQAAAEEGGGQPEQNGGAAASQQEAPA